MREKNRGALFIAITELIKLRITIAVTLSTLAGYVLYAGTIDAKGVWASLGVFLLAMSSSALNQYQEKNTDALMNRTRRRPLPSGRLSDKQAFLVITLLFFAGSLVLFIKTSMLSLGLGLLSFLWYNAIYTPLKYRTFFALIIGSLIGAIPPVIGWTAAGGHPLAQPILFLAFFIYIWQVPHFILLVLMYADDYKEAGLPVLTTYYSYKRVRRIIFVWIFGTMITGFMLADMCGLEYTASDILIIVLSAILMISMVMLKMYNKLFRVKPAFIVMNVYLVLVLLIITIDSLL